MDFVMRSIMKNYVIIGAMDGVSHDNIFDRLKDETEYQAYFIEPVPYYFEKLKENIKQFCKDYNL